jgi:hypothetical protein
MMTPRKTWRALEPQLIADSAEGVHQVLIASGWDIVTHSLPSHLPISGDPFFLSQPTVLHAACFYRARRTSNWLKTTISPRDLRSATNFKSYPFIQTCLMGPEPINIDLLKDVLNDDPELIDDLNVAISRGDVEAFQVILNAWILEHPCSSYDQILYGSTQPDSPLKLAMTAKENLISITQAVPAIVHPELMALV